MKNTLFSLLFLVLVGCGETQISHFHEEPDLDRVMEASTGSVFYSIEYMKGTLSAFDNLVYFGSSGKMELSVASASPGNLSLYHKEYMKPSDHKSAFYQEASWSIKPSFTQKYDYDIEDSNIIKFRKITFEILNIKENGSVSYKRINSE